MGKLYYTNDVKRFFDEKLSGMIMKFAQDDELTGSALGSAIEHVRLLRAFADEIVSDMEKADEEHDVEMAAWRSKQEAEKNGNS